MTVLYRLKLINLEREIILHHLEKVKLMMTESNLDSKNDLWLDNLNMQWILLLSYQLQMIDKSHPQMLNQMVCLL